MSKELVEIFRKYKGELEYDIATNDQINLYKLMYLIEKLLSQITDYYIKEISHNLKIIETSMKQLYASCLSYILIDRLSVINLNNIYGYDIIYNIITNTDIDILISMSFKSISQKIISSLIKETYVIYKPLINDTIIPELQYIITYTSDEDF